MSLINTPIGERNFELVRDRICEILTTELTAQKLMYSPTFSLLGAKVWSERAVPISEEDYPCINVVFVQDVFSSKDAKSTLGKATYGIEIWAKSATTGPADEQRGEVIARKDVQRLAGIIMAILENPVYKTLGFERPSLSGTAVVSIKIPERLADVTTGNASAALIEFSVDVTENNVLKTPIKIQNALTVVKLEDTDKGYFYEWAGSPA